VPTADDLEGVPLFAQLSVGTRSALAPRLSVEEFTPGQQIVAQGESGFSVFVMVQGRAAVTRDDKHLGYLGAGDHFGEMAVLAGDGRRTATVTAVSPVVAWVMFGPAFTSLEQNDPQVAADLRRVMNQRLEEDV